MTIKYIVQCVVFFAATVAFLIQVTNQYKIKRPGFLPYKVTKAMMHTASCTMQAGQGCCNSFSPLSESFVRNIYIIGSGTLVPSIGCHVILIMACHKHTFRGQGRKMLADFVYFSWDFVYIFNMFSQIMHLLHFYKGLGMLFLSQPAQI